MVRQALCVAASLAASLAAAGAAHAQTQLLTIQPVQVCDDVGANCAPVNIPLQIMNTIFAQANVVVGLAPTLKLNAGSFLTVDTVANSQSPTDEARVLMRGPHVAALGLSPQSTTLNVFFVDELREVNLGGQVSGNGNGLVGIGLINSNGAIVDRGARIDTLAHEIAHNLGLEHVALTRSLMADGAARLIPTGVADVAPTGMLSQLDAGQVAEVRNPLYTVNLARVTAEGPVPADLLDCTLSGFVNCLVFRFPSSPNNEKLRGVKLNFLPGTDVLPFASTAYGVDANGDPTFTPLPIAGSPSVLPDGTVQLVYDFSSLAGGGIAANQFTQFHAAYRSSDMNVFPSSYPLSVFYDFDSGVGTTGLFDILTGGASDRPILAQVSAPLPPSPLVPLTLELSSGEVAAAAVPAPAALPLLASACLALATLARRSRRAPARR